MVTNIDLWAKSGSIILPGRDPLPFWGFSGSAGAGAQLPGPRYDVMEGESLHITLSNQLPGTTSLVLSGVEFTPQPVKDGQGRFVSYNTEAAPGGSAAYDIVAARPGVFLYQSGTAPETQVQMGLYGVIVVRPLGYDPGNPSTWSGYGPGTGTEFDVEKVLVIGEVDTAWHEEIAGGGTPSDYDPGYFTLNGRSYPATVDPDDASSQPYGSGMAAAPGQRILLRIINAGFLNHTLSLDGVTARVVAGDSWPLKTSIDTTYRKNTITLGSGQSYDLLFTAPATGKYVIYDRDLNHVVNANQFPGGIITILEVT
ncbi:MAG: ferroxidase [Bacillota bacterium]|nr:MAG: ferroxidase [Bacillota bacterium]